MTNKEQIMIDGVDISECKKSWCSLKTCSGFRCAKWHILRAAQEKYKYKTIEEQLARKTQECEEKQKIIDELVSECKRISSNYKKDENRYRKALEEIKRICLEDTYTFTDGTTIRYDTLDDILDIVNREEGEKNE